MPNVIHLKAKAHDRTSATQFTNLSSEFRMWRGGRLHGAMVAYETWGTLSKKKDNAVLLFTGLSPSAHAASSLQDPSKGWWEYMIGPEKPIDTNRYFVICVNSLGSCFGSTGPATRKPDGKQFYRLDFPDLSIEDIAQTGTEVMKDLGITRLDTVIGASMGGMTALAFALEYPSIAQNLVLISSTLAASPFAIAIRSVQRDIIRSDPGWNGGNYRLQDPPTEGMRLARKVGLISYRSSNEWKERFGRKKVPLDTSQSEKFASEFEIENYLEHNSTKFLKKFDPNCYLYLSRAIDWFDVREHGKGLEEAIRKIRAKRTLVVGATTDILFPIAEQFEMARLFSSCKKPVEFVSIDSDHGHDAFLSDEQMFSPILEEFFKRKC